MNNSNISETIEETATTAIASASKSPFKTALKITLGIGLAHLAMFVIGIVTLGGLGYLGLYLLIKIFGN